MADTTVEQRQELHRMSNEVKHSLIWATAITLMVSSISWSVSWYYKSTTTIALENGYSQQTLPGHRGAYWVKTQDK